ncbi:MutS protein msh5 [Perkinsus olseni]|uniref:MutS protein msh5 n=1 Tax=Perkinsus olseni TaxID=32597 RepID=A0A7J6LN24_PEROL|nr:MutS protein msh5 [Perkinsus olseni]
MPPRTNTSRRKRASRGGGGQYELSNIRSRVYLSVCMEGSRLGIALLDIRTSGQGAAVQVSEINDALATMVRGIVDDSIDSGDGDDDDALGCLLLYPGKSPVALRNQLRDIIQSYERTRQQPETTASGGTSLVGSEHIQPSSNPRLLNAVERPASQYEYPSCVQRVLELLNKIRLSDQANASTSALPITGGHSQLWRALSGLLSFLDETGLLTRYRPTGVVMKSLEGFLLVDGVTLRTLGVTSAGRSTTIVAGHNHRVMTPSVSRLLGRYISSSPGRAILQRWLAMPCSDISVIESRLKGQEIMMDHVSPDLATQMSKNLKKHRDLSKILDRVTQGFNLDSSARVAAWLQLLRSCQAASETIRCIEMLPATSPLRSEVPCIARLLECRGPLLEIQHMLQGSFDLEAWAAAGPTHLSVKVGVMPELDALRDQYDKLEDILTRMGAAESKALEDRLVGPLSSSSSMLNSSLLPADYHGNDPSDPWYDTLSARGCTSSGPHPTTTTTSSSSCASGATLLRNKPIHIQLQYFPQMGFVASIPSADVQQVLVPLLSGTLSDDDTFGVRPSGEQGNGSDWQRCIDVVCKSLDGWEFKFRTADKAFFKSPITRRLDKYLGNIESKMKEIEYEYLYRLADRLEDIGSKPLAVATAALSELDCLLGLSRASGEHGWCRPTLVPQTVDDDVVLKLTGSWHPLMSDSTTNTTTGSNSDNRGHSVVPNDILITSDCRTHILTGPNYSGKSVLLKQIGLTAFLCHCGVYVPAKYCRMQLLTQLFARMASSDQKIPKFVGASERRQLEDIVRTSTLLSTFTRDAHEVSVALTNCTRSSLILLDEFGKGTSPIDEVSLLSGVVKYATIDLNVTAPTILLTTHYATELYSWGLVESPHEDASGEDRVKRPRRPAIGKAVPCRLAVLPPKDQSGAVAFLYKLERNKVSQASYPIQCAVASGVCPSVTDRAAEVLEALRSGRPLTKPRDPDESNHQSTAEDRTASRNNTSLQQTLVNFSRLDLSSGLNQATRAALHNILRQLRPEDTPRPLPRPHAVPIQNASPNISLGKSSGPNLQRSSSLYGLGKDLPSSSKGWSALIDEDLRTSRQPFMAHGGS